MKKTNKTIVVFLLAFLSGCATLGSPTATVICQTADTVTTVVGLERGATEANPLVAGVVDKLGYPGLIAVKILLVWLLIDLVKRNSDMAPAVAVVNVVSCAAAIHNIGVINGL